KYAPGDDGLPVAQAGEVIKGEAKKYTLTPYDLARLDQAIASTQRNIGTISNDIQLFNSYMWEGLRSGRESEYCQKIYECIMKLSVLNELEIDRSKHSVSINTKLIHRGIMDTEYKGEPILEGPDDKVKRKRVKNGVEEPAQELESYYNPVFLYEIKRDRGAKNLFIRPQKKYWDCPPDHLSELAAKIRKPRANYNKKRLIFNYNDVKDDMVPKQKNKIESLLKSAVRELDRIDKRRHKTGEELDERRKIQSDFVNEIIKMKSIPPKNIAYIVREAMCMKDEQEEEYYDRYIYTNKYRVLGLLFMAEEKIDEINRIKGENKNPIRQVLQKFQVLDIPSEEK
ncbi:MAG: hypothetical protein K6G19_02470, partial [Lachnospiraceae bacterium]|nr:hypothetical protein [Lachnospiraceae bacterium]